MTHQSHIFAPPVSWAGFILHVLAHELDRVCSQAEREAWVERVRAERKAAAEKRRAKK